jgi:hypothetical protein
VRGSGTEPERNLKPEPSEAPVQRIGLFSENRGAVSFTELMKALGRASGSDSRSLPQGITPAKTRVCYGAPVGSRGRSWRTSIAPQPQELVARVDRSWHRSYTSWA